MITDFSTEIYRKLLLALIESNYNFYTFTEIPSIDISAQPHVILRHDVDRIPSRALTIAEIESSLDIRSTFYFRTKPISFNKKIISSIYSLGHEIGYHYECLSDTKGNIDVAWKLFRNELSKFEQICNIRTIAMHGRPLLPYNNLDIWNKYNYKDLNILIEAYLDIADCAYQYFTDVGGCWDSPNNLRDHVESKSLPTTIHETCSLIEYIRLHKQNMIISTHPERWASSHIGWMQARATDKFTNIVKFLISNIL